MKMKNIKKRLSVLICCIFIDSFVKVKKSNISIGEILLKTMIIFVTIHMVLRWHLLKVAFI